MHVKESRHLIMASSHHLDFSDMLCFQLSSQELALGGKNVFNFPTANLDDLDVNIDSCKLEVHKEGKRITE